MTYNKICTICNTPFETLRVDQKGCSVECRREHYLRQRRIWHKAWRDKNRDKIKIINKKARDKLKAELLLLRNSNPKPKDLNTHLV